MLITAGLATIRKQKHSLLNASQHKQQLALILRPHQQMLLSMKSIQLEILQISLVSIRIQLLPLRAKAAHSNFSLTKPQGLQYKLTPQIVHIHLPLLQTMHLLKLSSSRSLQLALIKQILLIHLANQTLTQMTSKLTKGL